MKSVPSSEILLVGSELSANDRLRAELLSRACHVAIAYRGDEALKQAKSRRFDVVVSDVLSPGLSGLELLKHLHPAKPRLPIILVDKSADVENEIEATKLGSYEYFVGPLKLLELVEHILRAAASRRNVLASLDVGPAQPVRNGLIGSSAVMHQLFKEIGMAASAGCNILIRGGTGTGKELVARAIHQHSARATHPFVAVNTSAIPETLLENELFGHEVGAFTGARNRMLGRFEEAQGGTLFLDEIGDLTVAMQVKLLRVLQERSIQRLGSNREIKLDVRIVAATHRDLEVLIAGTRFREDLFYRLKSFTIRSPELSQHPQDILELTQHFLRKWQLEQSGEPVSICREAVALFENQAWPGNVRQLENAIYGAALLARGQPIELTHAEQACGHTRSPANDARRFRPEPLTDLVDRALAGEIKNLRQRALEQTDRSLFERIKSAAKGNQAMMAKWLGTTRTTVRQGLRKFGLLSPDGHDNSQHDTAPTDSEVNRAPSPGPVRDKNKGPNPRSSLL